MIIIWFFSAAFRLRSFTTTSAFCFKLNLKAFLCLSAPFFRALVKDLMALARSNRRVPQQLMLYNNNINVWTQEAVLSLHVGKKKWISMWIGIIQYETDQGKQAVFIICHQPVIIVYSWYNPLLFWLVSVCSECFTGYCSVSHSVACAVTTLMFLDASDVLKAVRQFLNWNINIHWQRLISCGEGNSPTELPIAEMIDILSLNHGVAISACL